jgi:hypothetical protein
MKLSKKGGGIAAAVVMAGGLAAATTTSAFAAPSGASHTAPVAKSTQKKDADKDDAKDKAHKHGRHALFLHGTHGQKTVKDKDGKTVIHEWQVGKVTAATATSLTVKSSDGVTWTWTISAETKVHSPKHAAPKVGDQVLIEGVKSGTANDARVVIDPDQAQLAKWLAHDQGKDDGDKQDAKDGKQAPVGKHRKAPAGGHGDDKAPTVPTTQTRA